MAPVKTIRVKMTPEQMKQMQELFEQVNESDGRVFVIGQVWEQGYMMVGVTNPVEVKAGMEKTIAKYYNKYV